MLGYAARSNVRASFDRETKKHSPSIMFKTLGGGEPDGDPSHPTSMAAPAATATSTSMTTAVCGRAGGGNGSTMNDDADLMHHEQQANFETASELFAGGLETAGIRMGCMDMGVGMNMGMGSVGMSSMGLGIANTGGLGSLEAPGLGFGAGRRAPDAQRLSLITKYKNDAVAVHGNSKLLQPSLSISRPARTKVDSRECAATRPHAPPTSSSTPASFGTKRISCIQCGRKDVTFGKNQRKKYGNRARCRQCTQADKSIGCGAIPGATETKASTSTAPSSNSESDDNHTSGSGWQVQGRTKRRSSRADRASKPNKLTTPPTGAATVTTTANSSVPVRASQINARPPDTRQENAVKAPATPVSRKMAATAMDAATGHDATRPDSVAATVSDEVNGTDSHDSRLAFFRGLTGKEEPSNELDGMAAAKPSIPTGTPLLASEPRFRSFSYGDYQDADDEVDDEEWARAVAEKEAAERQRQGRNSRSGQPVEESSVSMSGSLSIRFVASPHIGSRSVGSALIANETARHVVKSCLERGNPHQAMMEQRRSIEALEEVRGKVLDTTGALQRAIVEATEELRRLEQEYSGTAPIFGADNAEEFWGRAVNLDDFDDAPTFESDNPEGTSAGMKHLAGVVAPHLAGPR